MKLVKPFVYKNSYWKRSNAFHSSSEVADQLFIAVPFMKDFYFELLLYFLLLLTQCFTPRG